MPADFDLFNEFNILRIICGLFFIPHIVGKITVPATLDFFVKAGFKPPATWMYIAGAIETVLCVGLFFDIYTRYIGIIAFIHLLVAAAATYKLTKSWIWVIRRHRILRLLGNLLPGGRHARLALKDDICTKGNLNNGLANRSHIRLRASSPELA
jgi:putative oxidoreductase